MSFNLFNYQIYGRNRNHQFIEVYAVRPEPVVRNDDVRVLLRRLYPLLVSRLDLLLVFVEQVLQIGECAFLRHLQHSPGEPHIVVGVNEDLEVKQLHKFLIREDQVPFEDDEVGWVDSFSLLKSDLEILVVDWLVEGLAFLQELKAFLKGYWGRKGTMSRSQSMAEGLSKS